ncbi:MAG TPA: RNA methyltransferase [Kiritimatiellia bacterium]|nr:RNA methyltransferase [Kiritimatiellia bacterium]HRZ12836.1 RNA methyltransferase [Kiritimatiellia bacterium]HSA18212.1 RNA methyltransferase [Kiritimatiellia bacterium]
MSAEQKITSLQNPRVKDVVKLGRRPHRDEAGLLVVEGYRELRRALANHWKPNALFYCPPLYLGHHEPELVEACRQAGAELFECAEPVFAKMAYRDRPEGLLVTGPQVRWKLADLKLEKTSPLLVIAESIEKPGNLGTLLRSADSAGADAVLVCDPTTDINNPNVVRASIGTLFALPVVEASPEEALAWLRARGIRILAATPHAEQDYTQADMTGGTAIVVGSEQYGLKPFWMEHADLQVRIPMLGQADSLNVSAAATILLYEAVRQRRKKSHEIH